MIAVEQHVQAIVDRSAYDSDGLIAPKELWPLSQRTELEAWYEERKAREKR